MGEKLIKCSCCGDMLPAHNIELSFNLPDTVAAFQKKELNERCQYNDDICILDKERFFVRGLIPLPIHECEGNYSIGGWAEVSQYDYQKILDLWDDEEQYKEPPIAATLANKIPLNSDTLECDIVVKLTGSTTRPNIIIADEKCSLYKEQKCGINIHRAYEYAEYLEKSKKNIYSVIEEDELEKEECSCCEALIHQYCGHIRKGEEVFSDYWLRIPENHQGHFTVAISIKVGEQARVAVLLGEATNEGITYWIQDKKDSPWSSFGEYGDVLDRDDVLADNAKKTFFDIADRIAGNDSRLVNHITPYLNQE